MTRVPVPPSGAGSDRLACGQPVDGLIAQVADGLPAPRGVHQLDCPHCRAALAEYDRLWSPVRALAAEPVRPPQGLLETALGRLRAATANPSYGVLAEDDGQTRVAARVVVVVAREAAQHVAGVRVALSRITSEPPPDSPLDGDAASDGGAPAAAHAARVGVGVAGRSVAVALTVAANYGEDLVELGGRIRAVVAAQVNAATGLDPVDVSVIVDDVLPARGDHARRAV